MKQNGSSAQVGSDPSRIHGDPALVKALARAFHWQRMLETGYCATIDDLARRERIDPSYVSRIPRLTLLAPDIVERILDGQLAVQMTLPVSIKAFPEEWERQRWRL